MVFLGAHQGPLPVVGLRFAWFLIRYLAEPFFHVDWPALCVASGCGLDFLYVLFFPATTLAYNIRRARAISAIEGQLRFHGLPIPSEGVCLAPSHLHLPALRSLVSDTISFIGCHHPLYAAYLRSHTRINAVRRIPWSQYLPNAHRSFDPMTPRSYSRRH